MTMPAMSHAGPAPRAAKSGAAVKAPIAAARRAGRLGKTLRRGGVALRGGVGDRGLGAGGLDRLQIPCGIAISHHDGQRARRTRTTPSAARWRRPTRTDVSARPVACRTAGRPTGRSAASGGRRRSARS